MKFEVNDRVILVGWLHNVDKSNPNSGSSFACDGVVAERHGLDSVRVDWDNGHHNWYYDSSLRLANGDYKSIW